MIERDHLPTEPNETRGASPAKVIRHAYVAAAAVVSLVALVAAAVNGGPNDGDTTTELSGERAVRYYERLATIGRGLIATPVGKGQLPALPSAGSTLEDGTKFELSLDKPTQVTFVRVTIVPGSSIPWHRHSGPFLIELIKGRVVDYRPDRRGCAGETLPTGSAVFEPTTQIHTLTNPFDVPAEFYVVAWSPKGVDPTLHQLDAPAGCPENPR